VALEFMAKGLMVLLLLLEMVSEALVVAMVMLQTTVQTVTVQGHIQKVVTTAVEAVVLQVFTGVMVVMVVMV